MDEKYLKYVDTKFGSDSKMRLSRGNCLPLTQLPFGMHAFTLQTAVADGSWFYHPEDRSLEGIRLTHQPSPWIGDYGHFCFLPQRGGDIAFEPESRWSGFDPERAVLRPHYMETDFLRYRTELALTPTKRGGSLRLKYRGEEDARLALIPVDGELSYEINTSKKILTGSLKTKKSSVHENFTLYFVMKFNHVLPEAGHLVYGEGESVIEAKKTQDNIKGLSVLLGSMDARLAFATSYISLEQAFENFKQDGLDRDFELLLAENERIWDEHLSLIEVKSGQVNKMKTFYTCLYRLFLFPHTFHERDASGKAFHYKPNDGGIAEGVMYTDSSFWDTFRTSYPLLALIMPEKYEEILEGYVNIYKDSGWLPKWPSPGETGTMPGTLIDGVIAHAAVLGIASKELLEDAFEGMKKHAGQTADDPRYGRRGNREYAELGHIPSDIYKESVNHTLDYVYGDYCIATTARVLGREKEAETFYKNSYNYRKLFDSESGFMRGRDSKGKMKDDFDPLEWGGDYCEGGAWQNSFAVYHDFEGMAMLYGSHEAFEKKLNQLFACPPDYRVGTYPAEIHEMTEMALADFGQCAISNQPSFHLPYLYALCGAQEKTDYWIEKICDEGFHGDMKGFPGDEDNGSLAAWYLFSMMGFYPFCPGKAEYVKGICQLDEVKIKGRPITVGDFAGPIIRHDRLFADTGQANKPSI